MTSPLPPLALQPHPATPCPAVARLSVQASAAAGAHGPLLLLRYVLQGDLAALRWPALAPPGPADGLWQHTCFEAFIGSPTSSAYHEFNFAPNGQWASYAFASERVRSPSAPAIRPLRLARQRQRDTCTLEVALPAPTPAAGPASLLGLSAVIETQDGALSYWALHHPAPQPDFHHRGGWTARLPALDAAS